MKEYIKKIFQEENKQLNNLQIIFCSDAYLRKLNRAFLLHDTFTDILTFPLSSKDTPITAEIYVSIPRIKENARVYGTTFSDELRRVVFHGVLHLCEYKDKTKSQKNLMRAKEEENLAGYLNF